MSNVASAIKNTVSISDFNRGLAGKIFADVRKTSKSARGPTARITI